MLQLLSQRMVELTTSFFPRLLCSICLPSLPSSCHFTLCFTLCMQTIKRHSIPTDKKATNGGVNWCKEMYSCEQVQGTLYELCMLCASIFETKVHLQCAHKPGLLLSVIIASRTLVANWDMRTLPVDAGCSLAVDWQNNVSPA